MRPLPAYTETSLPGPVAERHELAARHDLALEVEDWGDLEPDHYARSGARIVTVQTCRLKRDPPTATGRRERARALEHMRDAIEAADRLGARRVITIAAYGPDAADRPFERSLETFDQVGRRARQLGVRVLIEPLSPKRSPLFHDPADVVELLQTLDQPTEFGLALDTGHLLDGDRDPAEILTEIDHPLIELQLRGADGEPPDPEAISGWIDALVTPPEVLAIEHRAPIALDTFERLVATLRAFAS